MCATATLFMHGRAQAVELPAEFHFAGTQVQITKVGDKVILEPFDSNTLHAQPGGPVCDATQSDDWRAQLPMPIDGTVLE